MKSMTGNFTQVYDWLAIALSEAPVVHVGEWQAIRSDIPQADTIEVEDVSFDIPIPGADVADLQYFIKPNLPWAEDHFVERVSGVPWNPPPSHAHWPFAQRSNDQFRTGERFSHSYPERIWPTAIEQEGIPVSVPRMGIRYPYGDLDDLVDILRRNQGTRQAYLPIWFPEDLAAAELGERVPCTLGYHFLIRNGNLKIVYYIRSCDFYRHFRDDVYMAARLGQWVAEQLEDVTASKLVMHISSLHIFAPEKERIRQEVQELRGRKVFKVR
jgi:hypothetical protein